MAPGLLACWPAAVGAVHQALPDGAGLLLVLVPVPQHGPWPMADGPWPMAPGVPDGAGLLLLMPFTRHCPSWCPA